MFEWFGYLPLYCASYRPPISTPVPVPVQPVQPVHLANLHGGVSGESVNFQIRCRCRRCRGAGGARGARGAEVPIFLGGANFLGGATFPRRCNFSSEGKFPRRCKFSSEVSIFPGGANLLGGANLVGGEQTNIFTANLLRVVSQTCILKFSNRMRLSRSKYIAHMINRHSNGTMFLVGHQTRQTHQSTQLGPTSQPSWQPYN